jgi:hypothetical protein
VQDRKFHASSFEPRSTATTTTLSNSVLVSFLVVCGSSLVLRGGPSLAFPCGPSQAFLPSRWSLLGLLDFLVVPPWLFVVGFSRGSSLARCGGSSLAFPRGSSLALRGGPSLVWRFLAVPCWLFLMVPSFWPFTLHYLSVSFLYIM